METKDVKDAKAAAYAAGCEAVSDAIIRLCDIMAEQLELEHDVDVPPYTPAEVAALFKRFGSKTVYDTSLRVQSNNPFELVALSDKDIARLRDGLPRVLRTPAAEPLASTRKRRPRLPKPMADITGTDP